jgi:hypothetical protein
LFLTEDYLMQPGKTMKQCARCGEYELDGVGQQVPDDLLQSIGVAGDWTSGRIEHGLQANRLCVGGGTDRVDGRVDDLNQVNRSYVEPQLAGNDARLIEEIGNKLSL